MKSVDQYKAKREKFTMKSRKKRQEKRGSQLGTKRGKLMSKREE